jgi:hypothetical protein
MLKMGKTGLQREMDAFFKETEDAEFNIRRGNENHVKRYQIPTNTHPDSHSMYNLAFLGPGIGLGSSLAKLLLRTQKTSSIYLET